MSRLQNLALIQNGDDSAQQATRNNLFSQNLNISISKVFFKNPYFSDKTPVKMTSR